MRRVGREGSVADFRWELTPGELVSRTWLNETFGGSGQRGISAPAASSGRSDILLFHDPLKAEQYGYRDGWDVDEEVFHFSGMGQRGDQAFDAHGISENRKVRDHKLTGSRLRLFTYVAKNRVRYEGQYALDDSCPYRLITAWGEKGERVVVDFRLVPVNEFLQDRPSAAKTRMRSGPAELVEALPPPHPSELEAVASPTFLQTREVQLSAARREEALLVERFASWLGQHGLEVCGYVVPYTPEGRPLRVDAYLPTPPTLIEAKSSSARELVRTAIGQLFDYRRYFDPRPALALLLPSEPADDLRHLLDELGIGLVYARAGGFHVAGPSELVEHVAQ